ALNLAFDLGGGQVTDVPVPTPGPGLPSGGVLAQAASGSVQQIAQLLSLTGSTLDLAATLLTVSVVPGNSEAAPAVSSTGLGQGLNPAKDNGGLGESRDELKQKPDDGAADAQAVVEKLPAWERLSIGLERAWERARALILDLEGQSPVAEGQKPARSPAANLP